MAKQKQISSLGSLMTQATDSLPQQESQKRRVRTTTTSSTEPIQIKGKVGRKPSNRTIARTNGLTIFLEDKHRTGISRIGGYDKQDIIRTAVDEFLKKYCESGNITEEGRRVIEKYIESTTIPFNEEETW